MEMPTETWGPFRNPHSFGPERRRHNFSQNPEFARAVNEIFRESIARWFSSRRSAATVDDMVLPNRRMSFHEVREIVSHHSQSAADSPALSQYPDRNEITQKIRLILDDINETSGRGETPRLIIRNQRLWSNCVFSDRITLKPFPEAKKTTVSYSPTKEKLKFYAIVYVLMKILDLLTKGSSCTKRELFYQNISHIKSQVSVDTAVRDICCLLEVPPWHLAVTATSKGLVAGPLSLVTSEGRTIDCMNAGGVLIPQDVIGIKSIESKAKFILVIEKDAIFQKLLDESVLERLGPCILLTGKGYPDANTRLLLRRLVEALGIQSFALTDGDPHGLEIMFTYRYGSLALSHLASELAVPSLRWLGIHATDISRLGAPSLALSARDQSKLRAIQERPYLQCPAGLAIRAQVDTMLANERKAEIEGIGTMSSAYLTDKYLPHKIITRDFM